MGKNKHNVNDRTKKEVGPYTFDEYMKAVKSFHGHTAPGLIVGGFMVDLALKNLPEGEFFDAVCETRACLPDALQMLTPCTIGNGWLKIFDFGRYALALYEKYSGQGIRVFLDTDKVKEWSEISGWFFKLKPKKEQDFDRLIQEIREAGSTICSMQKVQIKTMVTKIKHRTGFTVCPICDEAYPVDDGGACRACMGESPYIGSLKKADSVFPDSPKLNAIPIEQAVGKKVLHDMTRIIPNKEKGPAFKRDQLVLAEDICRLQQMGRQTVYTAENKPDDENWIHEDDAALSFAKKMAGDGVMHTEHPREGKADLIADRDGLFVTDEKRLQLFNMIPGVMCASRHGYSVVLKDLKLAGTRAIPLFLARTEFEKAMRILRDGPLFRTLSLRKANVGILVTGTEVFRGLVEDKFIPVIANKVKKLGSRVVSDVIVPDDRKEISKMIRQLLEKGADLIVTTAGLSVDPDDVTRQGLSDAGVTDMLYGAPILPGAMTLLARIGSVPVIGVPACALYYKSTSFDLLFPRILAGVDITREDLSRMGHGAFCLDCKTCTFPKCPFGKL
ncbi:MAG: trehalose-binding protein [Deltaproteobacteria bacterium]|nr:trehalose-binding protein [Deltaproteobacteria bacterium]